MVTLWGAVTLNFLIPRLMPGNAAIAMMSRYKGHVNPQAMHALQIAFGINAHESLAHAYFTYLGNIARGHFGISLTFFPDTVAHQVLQALPWTLALVGTTTILAFVLGTLIGLVSAWRRGGAIDGLLPPIFVITSAFPYFWLALLAIWVFSIKLGWLPESGGYDVTTTVAWSWSFISDAIVHSILPAMTILITSVGGWILTMRNNTIAILAEDYMRMALARNRKAVAGVLLLTFFLALATFPGQIAPYDPLAKAFQPGLGPSSAHWFGTTAYGEDVLSQLIWGTRQSMIIAFAVGGLATALAVLVGVSAAYLGGLTDGVLSLVTDVILVIPIFPLVIVLAAYQKNAGFGTLVIVLGALGW